jgi:type 1 glutamine amidotransferase
MRFYADTPQRRLAQDAPPVTPPVPLQGWCGLDRSREAPLPIDDSDGGCDDEPQCGQGSPWKRQIATLEIAPGDAITDSAEAYYLLRQRGIDRVIVLGVHLNMCVLGRPFAIRQLVKQGLQVLLVRDLTDTMYNSRRAPRVSHFAGTELMIAHVEKYWCPTITSADFVGGPAFRFQADRRPRTVFLIGEDEYRTWETLPIFAAQELETRGLPCAIVQQDPRDKNRFPGLHEALSDADLLLVSVRRRSPPRAQLDAIRAHLAAGKALVGIRTASHAFAVRANDPPDPGSDLAQWPGFDPEVLGGNYQGHHPAGPITTLAVAPGAADNPILQGIGIREFTSPSSLYRASPLAPEAGLLLLGSIPGKPAEPVAWTHCYGPRGARVFYTSLGGPDDFANPVFRRLLLNGILWAANQPITSEPSPTNRAGR